MKSAVIVGAAGPLGSAVLERALAAGGYAQVLALVTHPIEVALRGLVAVPVDAALAAPPAWRADAAIVVFDRERSLRHGRERAFFRPGPERLATLARWLQEAGVRRLAVVLPHAPALLPQALKAGLASLDEQAVAALGFEHLVFVRPTRQDGGAGAAIVSRGARLARAWLGQLRFMVPLREQPLRAGKVAEFVIALLGALPASTPGTRVAPPELLWDWAQPGGGAAVLQAWLAGRAAPTLAQPRQRW